MKIADAPGSGTVITLHEPHARVKSRRAVLASLVAFSLVAGALIAGYGTAYAVTWIVLIGIGLLVVALNALDDSRWRIRELPPYRAVRQLVITPESSGFRDAPRTLALHLDGQPLLLGAAPRVDLTRSGGRYHVNLVLEHEILVLDSMDAYETALARSHELSTVLGLAPPPANQSASVPAASDPNVADVVMGALFTLASVLGIVYWLASANFPDHVGLPLALAAGFSGALFAVLRRISLRVLRAEAAQSARVLHHLTIPADVSPQRGRRWSDKRFFWAMGGLGVVTLSTVWWLGSPRIFSTKSFCWDSEAPRICGIDVNHDGIPEAIGKTCSSWGLGSVDFRALDARSGATTESLGQAHPSNVIDCAPPFLDIDYSDKPDSVHMSAHKTILERSNSIWRVTLHGSVEEILRSEGCALVRTHVKERKDEWSTIELSTGGPCASISEPVSPESVEAARQKQEHPEARPGVSTAGGVTYSLTGSSRLTLSAWREDMLLWTTKLPARPLHDLPPVIAGSTVVVGANDLRTGSYLRIIGVDAESGRIRYVQRHPHTPKAHVDLAAAGAMVFIQAGRLAGLDAASGQIAWITK